ncbi:MAG: nitroreductase family protein [Candidatus Coproplasma sp.]
MDAIECLTNRRSIKAYKPDPVDEGVIKTILDAAMNAPTGMNRQSPIIIAVTNKELRDRLSKLNAKVLGTDNDPFYGAPAVLVVLADRNINTHVYDGSLVMGNIMNAAYAQGLGSCWIHRAKEVFDSKEGKEILSSLGIEGDFEGIGHCVLGYAACPKPTKRARKENYVYYVK